MKEFTTDKSVLDDAESYDIILTNGDTVKGLNYQKADAFVDGNPACFVDPNSTDSYDLEDNVLAWMLLADIEEKSMVAADITVYMKKLVKDSYISTSEMLREVSKKCNDLTKSDF